MERFNKFVAILNKALPGFKVKYKNESILMKLIGFVLFFNKAFMDRFITTVGYTVYFPNREFVENNPNTIITLAHEYVHAKDASKITRPLFGALYLLPQLLGILALLCWLVLGPLMIFGVLSWTWWLLIPLISLAFLAPIPAPFRMHYELRGYRMTLFAINELMKESGHSAENRIEYLRYLAGYQDSHFTGPNYYFMWPFGAKDKLNDVVMDIVSGEIVYKDKIYLEIQEAIKNSK